MIEKIDFKKQFKAYYSPKPGKPEIIMVPPMQFVMIDGTGGFPETTTEFRAAFQAIYPTVYGLKFGRKKAGIAPDFGLGPLEALWWMKDKSEFDQSRPEDWRWTLMMWLPNVITHQTFEAFIVELKTKKPQIITDKLRLEVFDQGMVVQIMHIGPYVGEAQDIMLLHDYAKEQGYALHGKHHEIYLGDPRRSAPEKLRTILRHPVIMI